MKNIGKWMKRNWVMFVTSVVPLAIFAWCVINYYNSSITILAIVGSCKIGDWIDRFSVWANDKILGTEEDSDED